MSTPGSRGVRKFDFYRKIPIDLTESTVHGGAISLLAIIAMTFLLLVELSAFMSTQTESRVAVDFNTERQFLCGLVNGDVSSDDGVILFIRINFNITMLDLSCDYATVDVLDVLGTNRPNVTKNIQKWSLDKDAQIKMFQGRNKEERDLLHDEHHPDLEKMLENGEHAVHLKADQFKSFVESNKYVFANFYAPWCVWCQKLAPIWEALAETMEQKGFDVKVIKIDCVENRDLCNQEMIRAFPTLRLFKEGRGIPPDYREDRTVDSFTAYVERTLDLHAKIEQASPENRQLVEESLEAKAKEEPGCLLTGFLLVNRVPGNFHIEARSKYHNLNPTMTNVSHIVHDLTFGPYATKEYRLKLQKLAQEYRQVESPLAGRVFVNDKVHEAFHHYLKVVSTHHEVGGGFSRKESVLQYQMVVQDQVMRYQENEVPEAKFSYDISPMSVVISSKRKRWYEFVTSTLAIIGGAYTVLGLIDGVLYKLFKPKKF